MSDNPYSEIWCGLCRECGQNAHHAWNEGYTAGVADREAAVDEARQEERRRCIEIAKLHLEAMHELPDVLAALAGPVPDAMSLKAMREYEADDRG